MGPRTIRVLAVLATLLVFAGGTWVSRDLFLEQLASYFTWTPEPVPGEEGDVPPPHPELVPQRIVIDAGPGVRVRVEGQTGRAGVWGLTRSWFAHADLQRWGSDELVARCQTPTPLSRCAIWLSVTTATDRDTVVIREHPGSIIDGSSARNVAVTVEPVR